MSKWEYKFGSTKELGDKVVYSTSEIYPTTEAWLNEMGADGWELVEILDYESRSFEAIYVFKRPINEYETVE